MSEHPDLTAVALAILRVTVPDAEVSDLTVVDLDEAQAALDVIYGPKVIR